MRWPILLIMPALLLAPVRAAELARELERAAGGREAPGIALIVARSGTVETLAVAGFADRSRRVPLTAEDLWPLGELSRLITALLCAELAAAGTLDLDRPLSAWIARDEVDFDPNALTLRDLLAHRSGLPPARLAGAYRRREDPPAPLAPADFHLAQPPRLLIQPSALAFVLAGRALERAAGTPFPELLAEHIASPLGLITLGPAEGASLIAAHRRGRAEPPLLPRDLPANGLAMSARDLARLLAALTAPEPPLRGRERLFEGHQARLGFGASAGLGLSLTHSTIPGTGHLALLDAAYPGYRAQLVLALDHRVGVAVLANAGESFRTVNRLIDLALDHALGRDPKAREAARRAREQPPARMPWPEGATPAPPAARYATPFGLIEVEGAGDAFRAEVFGFRFAAERREDGWYRVRYRLLGLVPIGFEALDRVLLAPAEIEGGAYLLAALGGRTFLLGSAVAAPPPADGASALVGRWKVESRDPLLEQFEIREARIALESQLLTLSYELPFLVFSLRPRILLAGENGSLRVFGTGPGLGERIRWGQDERGDYLEYSGFRLRRVP
jgi:CubicO group peptidase (beta-lactamase class C family)